jgi:hypothetical protein
MGKNKTDQRSLRYKLGKKEKTARHPNPHLAKTHPLLIPVCFCFFCLGFCFFISIFWL